MPVCRYYLQGTCRHGNACKNDHQIDVSNYQQLNHTGIPLSYQGFQTQPSQPQTKSQQNVDDQTLIKSAANDMIAAEKGGQWILSFYAPFKEKAVFPGFIDLSFEEARFGYYEALKNGTVESYKQEFQKMWQTAMAQVKLLQSPNPNVLNMLKAIYNNQPLPSSETVFGQLFSQQIQPTNQPPPQQQSMFNNQSMSVQQQPSQSIFANQQSMKPIFGGQTSQQSNQSIFANQATQQPSNKPLFGGQIGQQQSNQPLFTNQASQQPSNKPLFGGQIGQQQSNQPVFTNQASQQSSNKPIFGGQTGQQQQPPPNQSIFPSQINQQANPNTNELKFINQQNNQQLNMTINNQSILLNQQTNAAAAAAAALNNQHKQVKTTVEPSEDYYSKLEELNNKDVEWFENENNLNEYEIPVKPPTKEMCF